MEQRVAKRHRHVVTNRSCSRKLVACRCGVVEVYARRRRARQDSRLRGLLHGPSHKHDTPSRISENMQQLHEVVFGNNVTAWYNL
jgi:hypothetical protein